MPDDPDESFIVDTVLRHRPEGAPRGSTSAPMSPGDDAAVVSETECVTVDAMVEGVHWDDRLSPADVGWKLVACNASDINAMGGIPTWGVLTIAIPRPIDTDWVESFARGLGAAMGTWNITLVGGDTTRSPGPRMVSLTLAGTLTVPIGRDGAKPGDDLWVSGPLGGPAAVFGNRALDPTPLARPHPPIGLGSRLRGVATSMMDLSDGLARDLPRLCAASEVGAVVDPSSLPIHPAAESDIALAVGFGEEYELLFTAPPAARDSVLGAALDAGCVPSRVGIITSNRDVRLSDMPWPTPLFSHFGGDQ